MYFQYSELTFCESAQPVRTLCQDVRVLKTVRKVLCAYVLYVLSDFQKYIDLDKKHYFNIQAFVCKDILNLARQYAGNNLGIRVLSCNCVRVAVYCVIALLLIGNCPEDRILFNALMHGTFNTGLYRISNIR